MKKILVLAIAILAFSGSSALAGGSMDPYIRAITLNKSFGVSSRPNKVIISFCNNDGNKNLKKVNLKLQTTAVETNGKQPTTKQARTISYKTSAKLGADGCGIAKINVKNGKFNVEVKLKEQEGTGKEKFWTDWSTPWTTN